jgi:hypothetical protein
VVLGRRVERQGLVVEGPGGEERDDLLGELEGPVVVRAVRDGGRRPEGLDVGPDGVVGSGLRRVVGGPGPVGIILGERLVGIEGKIAVDLTGRDVVEPRHLGVPGRLEHGLGPEDVGAEEEARIEDGEGVVGLGGEVDDRVDRVAPQRLEGEPHVADVTPDEADPVLDVGQGRPVPGVRQGVVGDHGVVGVVLHPVTDEVRTDETGAPGHE